MSTTPPRNVIYYNDGSNPISLAGISGLPYTDIILAFLVPDGNLNLMGQGGAFDSNGNPNPNDIQTLQNAGKNVLISVGGDTQYFPSSAWQQYAQDVNGLVEQLVGYVTANGLNGVDIDYEDDNGFTGTYDGITFLIDLTNGLAQNCRRGRTSSPMPHNRPILIQPGASATHTPRYGRERAVISPGSTASSTTTPRIARRPAARFPGMRPSLALQAHQGC